jgi:copper chaperone CopZ
VPFQNSTLTTGCSVQFAHGATKSQGIINSIRDKGKSMAEFTLRIDGMHCGACVKRVTQALASTDGVVVNEVRVGAARFTSTADPAPVEQALAAVAKAGFAARLEA